MGRGESSDRLLYGSHVAHGALSAALGLPGIAKARECIEEGKTLVVSDRQPAFGTLPGVTMELTLHEGIDPYFNDDEITVFCDRAELDPWRERLPCAELISWDLRSDQAEVEEAEESPPDPDGRLLILDFTPTSAMLEGWSPSPKALKDLLEQTSAYGQLIALCPDAGDARMLARTLPESELVAI